MAHPRGRARQGARSSRWTLLWISIGGAAAVAAVMVGLSLATRPAGIGPVEGLAVEGRTKGSPEAPILVEEWGDFQ